MLQIGNTWKSEGSVGKDNSETYHAKVFGDPNPETDNAADLMTVLAFALPRFAVLSYLGNPLSGITWDSEENAPGVWTFHANYKSSTETRQTNDASFSFQLGGASQHITVALDTVGDPVVAPGQPAAPDLQNTINNNGESVEGMDIDVGNYEFKTTFYIAPSKMTTGYLNQLKAAMLAPVNKDVVSLNIDGVQQTFQPGELRLKGAEGTKRKGFTDWEFSLNWSSSPNATNLKVGPCVIPKKNGWDYLDINYKKTIDTQTLLPQIWFVRVLKVYTYSSLSGLIPASAFGLNNTQFWKTPSATTGGGFT